MLYETSLTKTKMILFITSILKNRIFQCIDTSHSIFTFCHTFIFLHLDDDISFLFEISISQKLEKLLIGSVLDFASDLEDFISTKLID